MHTLLKKVCCINQKYCARIQNISKTNFVNFTLELISFLYKSIQYQKLGLTFLFHLIGKLLFLFCFFKALQI